MLKKISTTFIISLASLSLLGVNMTTNPLVAHAAINTGVQVLSTSTSSDIQSVFNIFGEVADILGLDEQTVINKVTSGSTLGEIAESNGFSESVLLELLIDRAETNINAALEDGTITSTEASNMKLYLPVMLKLLVENKYFQSSNLLSAPVSLTATSKNVTTITLNWSSVTNATTYYVYRSTSTYGSYKKLATVKTTTYVDKTAAKGTTYYYKIKAVSSTGTSPYSSVLKAVVGSNSSISSSSLSAPSSITATTASSTKITLKWSSVSAATYYYVYRAASSSGTYSKIGSSTTTSYTDSSLNEETTYYYKVIALNASSQSGYSAIVNATTNTAESDLDTPENLVAASAGDDEIILQWDEVDNADGYYIYRSATKSGTYSKIDTIDDTEYINDDLAADTTYYYKVMAYNEDGASEFSSIVYATTDDDDSSDSDLDTPDNLKVSDSDEDSVSLEWDEVDDADGYYIYRSTAKSGTYTKIDTTDDTEYTDEDLSADSTYYYKVKAYNDDYTSSYSSIVKATTDDDGLDAPDDLSVSDVTDDSVTLEWDEVDNADSYYIYRATSKTGTYTRIDTTEDTEFTDYNVNDDTTYYYKIKAYNSGGTSDYSSIVKATTDEE